MNLYPLGALKGAPLDERRQGIVTLALKVAAEQYLKDAEACTQVAADLDSAPEPAEGRIRFMTPYGARMLADRFRQQAADALRMLADIEGDEEEGLPGYRLAFVEEERW